MNAEPERLIDIDELARQAGRRLQELRVAQANGQVTARPDIRTLRWYTTVGLLDRPVERRGRRAFYGQHHVAQVVAVKRLQAEGVSLTDVAARLAGLSTAALMAIAHDPAAHDPAAHDPAANPAMGGPVSRGSATDGADNPASEGLASEGLASDGPVSGGAPDGPVSSGTAGGRVPRGKAGGTVSDGPVSDGPVSGGTAGGPASGGAVSGGPVSRGSATDRAGGPVIGGPATDPPATDPPATDPPATDPPATEGSAADGADGPPSGAIRGTETSARPAPVARAAYGRGARPSPPPASADAPSAAGETAAFWSVPPLSRSVGVPGVLAGVALDHTTSITFAAPRPLTAADVEAVRRAALPLLDELRRRGLVPVPLHLTDLPKDRHS